MSFQIRERNKNKSEKITPADFCPLSIIQRNGNERNPCFHRQLSRPGEELEVDRIVYRLSRIVKRGNKQCTFRPLHRQFVRHRCFCAINHLSESIDSLLPTAISSGLSRFLEEAGLCVWFTVIRLVLLILECVTADEVSAVKINLCCHVGSEAGR